MNFFGLSFEELLQKLRQSKALRGLMVLAMALAVFGLAPQLPLS